MKKVTLLLSILVCLLAATGLAADDNKASETAASETATSETLHGEYKWVRMDEPGPIKAVFTSTGDHQWDVSFYFDFRDEAHIYSGTATGSLSEGELKGEVLSDGEEPHPFSFEGAFVDGTFSGTHTTMGEDAQETGTITLGRQAD